MYEDDPVVKCRKPNILESRISMYVTTEFLTTGATICWIAAVLVPLSILILMWGVEE